MELTPLDLTVVAVYGIATIGLGFWVGRGERDATDYFLAGRALPWYLIGLSLYASNMSGASFVGLMGAAYSEGMVVFNYEWTAALVLVLFAACMLPVFLRARLFTVPEYLEARFDRRSRWTYAGLTLLTLLFIDMAGALYAGGVVVSTMFPGVSLRTAAAAMAVLAGAYTLFGGLRSVVVTDALQAVLMIVGAGLIFALGLFEVGGWDALMARLDETQTRLIRPADDAFLPWPGIGGVILLGLYYWTLNQYFVQRALAARTLDEGRMGALFGGLLKLPNLLLMIVPGMIAIVLLPDLESADQAFPALAAELLPPGLRGLIVTALLAAIMSSLDSALNAAASLLTMDFVRPLRPRTSGRALLWIGRAFTGLLIVMAALYAPVIESFGSLFKYFQATLSYIVPPVVAVYMGGLFWRRMTPPAAFAALAAGLSVGLTLFLLKEVTGVWSAAGLPPVHFTYMALIMFALSVFVLVTLSLSPGTAAPAAAELTFGWRDLRPGFGGEAVSPGLDYRLYGVALLLATGLLIGLFW